MGIDIKKILMTIGLGAAGAGATAANAATGGLLTPLTKTVLDALGAQLDPAARAKLEAAAAAASADLQKAEFDHAEKIAVIAAADTASARAREVAVRDRIPGILALSVTGGFFSLLFLMIFRPIPVANGDLMKVMLGSLGTAWILITGYYFGSSAGSADKTAMLGKFREQMGKMNESEDRKIERSADQPVKQ
jgi:hypothetical protein